MCKGTKIFSEVSSFFEKSGKISAIGAISAVLKNVKFSSRSFSFEKPRHNCLYPALCILQLLLMFPCFSVANPANYTDSPLFKLVSCHKDVFYEFLNNGKTKWRKIMYYINRQLWAKITVRGDYKKRKLPMVLIFDDTDIIKASSGIEMVSRIFSHVTNSRHWGYKGLFCCLSDGISQDKWRAYITTDMKLEFGRAFRIYSMRWAIEVCNKEEKSLLGMHKCQSRHFAAQIAHVSITCLQYNILSLAKRFSDYETIGELFRGTVDDAQEVAFAERVMEFFLEIVPELEETCGCDTDKLIGTLIHKPEKSAVFVKICERLAA